MTEELAVLFAENFEPASMFTPGRSLDPSAPPVGFWFELDPVMKGLLERVQQIAHECRDGARWQDSRPYVTALHALVLDLVDATGAPMNGRRHPAHTELVEDLLLRRGWAPR